MKGYFAVDLIIDKEDNINIIDIHGFMDAISFTEKAGYLPRKSRIHKFMQLAKEKANNKKIIYMAEQIKQYDLPDSVFDFFATLPKDSYNLNWIAEERKREKTLTHHIFKNELIYLEQSANLVGADFIAGELVHYDDKLCFNRFFVKKMLQQVIEIPYDEIGLILFWGNNYVKHPQVQTYWRNEMVPLPVINNRYVHGMFNSESKCTSYEALNYVTENIPDTIFIGMARSSSQEISEFVEKYDSFIFKPVCTHGGIDIRHLSKEEAFDLAKKEKTIEKYYSEINEKINMAETEGFKPDEEKFKGFFMANETNPYFPVKNIGTYMLQEKIIARPFKSFKTNLNHTGTIRAQIYAGEPIGVMHRFSTQEYTGKLQRITDKEHRTFWEKTDEVLEKRIVDFLVPIFEVFEENLSN